MPADFRVTGALLLGAALALPASAQEVAEHPLSLEAALRHADASAPAVQAARAGVTRARATHLRVRGRRLPEVEAGAGYIHLRAPALAGAVGGTPLPEGVVFGVEGEGVWRAGIGLAYRLPLWGSARAEGRIARAAREDAGIELGTRRARVALEVTEAYADALLSDRLAALAAAEAARADSALIRLEDGDEVATLRARVRREHARAASHRLDSERRIAHGRLAAAIGLPAGTALRLTTPLEPEDDTRPTEGGAGGEAAERGALRQAALRVDAAASGVRLATAEGRPALRLRSGYGAVGSAEGGGGGERVHGYFAVALDLALPLLAGGRARAERMEAEADLLEARIALRAARDAAEAEAREAGERLREAEARYRAAGGIVADAARHRALLGARYREGAATYGELVEADALLRDAETAHAVAARDLRVARARAALLPDLPLEGGVE